MKPLPVWRRWLRRKLRREAFPPPRPAVGAAVSCSGVFTGYSTSDLSRRPADALTIPPVPVVYPPHVARLLAQRDQLRDALSSLLRRVEGVRDEEWLFNCRERARAALRAAEDGS